MAVGRAFLALIVFLLSPRLDRADDLRALLRDGPVSERLAKTRSFSLVLPEGAASSDEDEIGIEVRILPER